MVEEQGIKENTLIILTADHAIEPGKSTCYERGLKVPFIVSWPARIKEAGETQEIVQFTDFLPSFAEIAGVTREFDEQIDGKSFLPVLLGESIAEREYIYSEEGYTRAVTGEKYKYISMRFPDEVLENIKSGEAGIITHFGDEFQAHGLIASKYHKGYFDADQLYDLENDPWEQNNLAYDPVYSEILADLKNVLSGFTQSFEHPFPVEENDYMHWDQYQDLTNKTKKMGTDRIYWWKRELEYPPVSSDK